jgi:alpha-L-arabinofuranosidase
MNGLRAGVSCLLGLVVAATAWGQGTAVITVDAAREGPRVDPKMYGIFLEEINHGVDGGLYAELVANRAFEAARPPEGFTLQGGRWKDAKGYDSGFDVKPGEIPRWEVVRTGDAKGTVEVEATGGLNEGSPYCLRVEAGDLGGGRLGVANLGYWGMGLKQGARYRLLLHARGEGALRVRLEDAAGAAVSEEARFEVAGEGWAAHEATLEATRSEPKARLVVEATRPGTVWLDYVSLVPAETWKGHGLRPDIAEMIAALKPGFVRFPGGCVVEGGTFETAWDWRDAIGPPVGRPERWTAWSVRRTHGMGYPEYLQFCEDLGAAPLYVGFAGQTCLFRQSENVPMEEMPGVMERFRDALAYAKDPVGTPWGDRRAADGHPEPFDLRLVEVGNENGTEAFPPRYKLVQEGLAAAYPDVKWIADLSFLSPEMMRECRFDIEDNHFYNNPAWFFDHFGHYDDRDRGRAPVYVGEVAVTSPEGGDLKGNLLAALSEGVFLMGCERNADVVKMVSYAPLLAHVDGRSGWHGMIYHDSTRVFGTASYHLWKLFGTNRPDVMLGTEVAHEAPPAAPIAGAIGVGTWETSAEFKDVRVERDGKVLFASDFAAGTQGWRTDGGRWSVVDGAYRQSAPVNGFSFTGDESWTGYTLSLKARKLRGAEGFLVSFGRSGGDQFWWNLGGWGNREHGVERNRTPVGPRVRGRIEADRWYDVKVELDGRRIRCYLDGALVHDVEATESSRFFAVAGRNEEAGEVVIKAVNASEVPVTATVNLRGVEGVGPEAEAIVLTAERLDANNSFEEPEKVAPVTTTVPVAGPSFEHAFPARSFTLLRVKAR